MSGRSAAIHVVLLWMTLVVVRYTAPNDILDNDQIRPIAYVLDVLDRGAWICPTDATGDVASKPPLSTWMAVLSVRVFGESWRSIAFVSALALLGQGLLVLGFLTRHTSATTGAVAAAALFLSPYGFKQLSLIRSDPLYALLVPAAALALLRARRGESNYIAFWILAAACTLTKGPIGLTFIAAGLVVRPLETTSDAPSPSRRRYGWIGFIVFESLIVGWFVLAYRAHGEALVEKMLGRELVGHALVDHDGRRPFSGLHRPLFYLATRFAPWSIVIAAFAFDRRRRGGYVLVPSERFLAVVASAGLVVFSIAPHQRPDHLMPLIPLVLCAFGRCLERRSGGCTSFYVVAVVGLIAFVVKQHLHPSSAGFEGPLRDIPSPFIR